MGFLGQGEPPTKIFNKINIIPTPQNPPEMWMLGSSDQSALMAAQFGLAFSFAHFIVQDGGKEVLADYRSNFNSSEFFEKPDTSLCIFIICAENEKKARQLALCRDLSLLFRERGHFRPFPSVTEAEAYEYSEMEKAIIDRNRSKSLYGDANQCRQIIEDMAKAYGVKEMVILSICHDPNDRKRSYELIANAFYK